VSNSQVSSLSIEESWELLPSPFPRLSSWQCTYGTRTTCCSHSNFLFTYRISAEGACFNPSAQDLPQSLTMDVDMCTISGQGKEGGELLQCCEITVQLWRTQAACRHWRNRCPASPLTIVHVISQHWTRCLPPRAKQGVRFSLWEWRCLGCTAKREAALRQKTHSKTSDGLVTREGRR
jgi:hypothetical protein